MSTTPKILKSPVQLGDIAGEGAALGCIGNIYDELKDYARAIEYHQRDLAISRQIGEKAAEEGALVNLANAYSEQGNYNQAVDNYHQALAISQQLGDRWGEGNIRSNLGETLIKLERYQDAFASLCSALEIAQAIGSRSIEAHTLQHLAVLHQTIGDGKQAYDYCDRALKLATDIGIPLVRECQDLKERLLNDQLDRKNSDK